MERRSSQQHIAMKAVKCIFAHWQSMKRVCIAIYSQEKIRKRRLFKKVKTFCEEKVLRYLFGVFWYAESKNQCWQAEKWHLYYLICVFTRWPQN